MVTEVALLQSKIAPSLAGLALGEEPRNTQEQYNGGIIKAFYRSIDILTFIKFILRQAKMPFLHFSLNYREMFRDEKYFIA